MYILFVFMDVYQWLCDILFVWYLKAVDAQTGSTWAVLSPTGGQRSSWSQRSTGKLII